MGVHSLVRPRQVKRLGGMLATKLWPLPPVEQVAVFLAHGRLRYAKEPGTSDLWQSPRLTLSRGGGDCEDLAILGMSLLIALGLDDVVLVLGTLHSRTRRPQGHAWLEGWDRQGWFLLEATTGRLIRHRRPDEYVPLEVLKPNDANPQGSFKT